MDYLLENLQPDSFQQLVQALLVRDFPTLQCFPVGQADGGRDAIALYPSRSHVGHEYILFQVKFSRQPSKVDDPLKWLTATLQDEISKINRQALKGAKSYVLVTNVRGTSKEDSGTMDRAQEILDKVLPIPASCWWHDDLARRLDTAWALKWQYPEILTSLDVLRAVVESGLSEHASRRTDSIRATIAHQYEQEKEVRFKQVELRTKLLDVVVDSPLLFPHPHNEDTNAFHAYNHLSRHNRLSFSDSGPPWRSAREANEERAHIGTGTFFLSTEAQKLVNRAVLEGAPGQGKSTLTQYVCQVHRLRILAKTDELLQVPENHRTCPIRIPLRIDLRDFAMWLQRRDPYSAEPSSPVGEDWNKSLESFLAALIRHCSGGAQFNVSDLQAVVGRSAILLAFDGLDEVADIRSRAEVVEELHRGLNRLQELAASLQTIITSRPAAFANSPGMPTQQYPYFRLGPLTRPLVVSYAQRWASARGVTGREQSELLKSLDEKLDLPHLRDLARNPMQLTILLSLVHSKGASLPDKRTALYDAYIDLFFSRESEKSTIVRSHREVLQNVHRYVGWLLHSESEVDHSASRISLTRLKEVIRTYLENEGYDPEIANDMFHGVVERVVALVSRIQGTYEFEVQPLQEYFAARHLYETAPYSPTGAERVGTKPERFAALARNLYWLNVARFYAGCYSKGELASLIDGLRELQSDALFAKLRHSRTLAATLLSDWVFSQHPRSVREVVGMTFDAIGLGHLLATPDYDAPGSVVTLADAHARKELLVHCWDALERMPSRDLSQLVCRLMQENSLGEETYDEWLKRLGKNSDRSRWLEYGLYLGHLRHCEPELLASLADPSQPSHIDVLFRARRFSFLESKGPFRESALAALLDGAPLRANRPGEESMLLALGAALDMRRYSRAFDNPEPRPLRLFWEQQYPISDVPPSGENDGLTPLVEQLVTIVRTLGERLASEWATSLQPWNEMVESGRSLFGDSWCFFRIAALAAGIRSSEARAPEADNLLDSSSPLCSRARYARLRSGSETWWRRELSSISCGGDSQSFALLVCLCWASSRTLVALEDFLSSQLDALPAPAWARLYAGCVDVARATSFRDSSARFQHVQWPRRMSPRLAVALMQRSRREDAHELYRHHVRTSTVKDAEILDACMSTAFSYLLEASDWHKDLEFIRESHAAGAYLDRSSPVWFRRATRERSLSLELARKVCEEPMQYPTQLVAAAEQRLLGDTLKAVKPLAHIASDEKWFA